MTEPTPESLPAAPPPPSHVQPVLAYASPMTSNAGVWREGNQIVTTRDADLGDACVKCGMPSDGWRWRRKVWWHSPGFFLLILFPGILIYAIVALCIRKKARIEAALCPRHRSRRRKGLILATLLAIAGLAALIGGFAYAADARYGDDWGTVAILGGFALFIASAVIGMSMARVLAVKRITSENAWYQGAGLAFLRNLDVRR